MALHFKYTRKNMKILCINVECTTNVEQKHKWLITLLFCLPCLTKGNVIIKSSFLGYKARNNSLLLNLFNVK
jgi:hypothetical protein